MMRETILLVFFDLPVSDRKSRRDYQRFRSGLKKSGYTMLQKSVYYKLITNVSMKQSEKLKLGQIAPKEGEIQFLPLPLRLFTQMSCILGVPFDFPRFLSPIIEI